MKKRIEKLETTRIITRTIALGFIILTGTVAIITSDDGIFLLSILSLFIGYLLSLLWRKLDPVTNDDFLDT